MRITYIRHESQAGRGTYIASISDSIEPARLTYQIASPGLILADHSETPSEVRGHGIAQALVSRMVEDARTGGYRIMPICSYISSQFQKHPEWSDVLRC
jgi:predicted GNAT family acetyltransferase